MKAVIVDIMDSAAAAMDENGQIVRISNQSYEIGQQIELESLGLEEQSSIAFRESATGRKRSVSKTIRAISAAAAAVILLALIGTGTVYAMPYGTVTLNGSSSIEYTINRFNRVIRVSAQDEEGEAIIEEVGVNNLRGQSVESAVKATLEQIDRRAGVDEERIISINVESKNADFIEKLKDELDVMIERPGQIEEAPAAQISSPEEVIPGSYGQSGAMPSEAIQSEPVPSEDIQPEAVQQGNPDQKFEQDTPVRDDGALENSQAAPDNYTDQNFGNNSSPAENGFQQSEGLIYPDDEITFH